jgi:hypothetical protein
MNILQKDQKRLFGLSAGRCNICNFGAVNQIIETAHIFAKNPGGPRGFIKKQNDNSYNNLILLCPNCHTEVDKYPDTYTPEKLHKIKKEHEEIISLKLDFNKKYLQDISSLNILFKIMPIRKFIGMATTLPAKISINFNARYMFDQFRKDNPDKYPFYDVKLTNLFNDSLIKIDSLTDWINGTISNTSNRLITINEMQSNNNSNDGVGYNAYVDDGCENMVINKKYLNNKQTDKISDEMPKQIQNFIDTHTNLINYIRDNYNDIQW